MESFHQCAGYPKKHDEATRRIANVVWGGVDLRELLRAIGIRPEAQYVWAYGLDRGKFNGMGGGHYQKDMPLARLSQGDVLLAYEINGEPLTPEHGFPVRLVIPGYYGTNDVKWLGRLTLSGHRATGIYTTVLYNDPVPLAPGQTVPKTRPVWAAPPESLIVSPQPGARLDRAAMEIWGWAWASTGVTRVDISTDDSASWSPASLEPRAQWSWQRFAFSWTPSGPGPFTIVARATDADGTTQPMSRARNAVHSVTIDVVTGSVER